MSFHQNWILFFMFSGIKRPSIWSVALFHIYIFPTKLLTQSQLGQAACRSPATLVKISSTENIFQYVSIRLSILDSDEITNHHFSRNNTQKKTKTQIPAGGGFFESNFIYLCVKYRCKRVGCSSTSLVLMMRSGVSQITGPTCTILGQQIFSLQVFLLVFEVQSASRNLKLSSHCVGRMKYHVAFVADRICNVHFCSPLLIIIIILVM